MVNQLLKAPEGPPSDVEQIKDKSNYLRGTLGEVMLDRISAGIPDDDNRLMKHHGSYLQDDRDLRNERQKQKLEPRVSVHAACPYARWRGIACSMACHGRTGPKIRQ